MMSEDHSSIRELAAPAELAESLDIIRASFQTVADQFGLTRENCRGHTVFITIDELEHMQTRGVRLFGLFSGTEQVGFIAVECSEGGSFWIEKLAVLPSERHRGWGRKLVMHAIDHIRTKGGDTVCLGMIDEHAVLKDWYKSLGFVEISIRKFAHLPFTVCMMERDLRAN